MRILTTISLFALLATVATVVPTAFADHPTATIDMPMGTGVPGCEEHNVCFVPADTQVDVGGSATWTNSDSVLHTVWAGNLEEDATVVGYDYNPPGQDYNPPSGFQSGLVNPGDAFTVKDLKEGDYAYYCSVHPWMKGMLRVTAAHADEGDSMTTSASNSDDMRENNENMNGDKMEDGSMTGDKMEDGSMTGDKMTDDHMMMKSDIPKSIDDIVVMIETEGGDAGSPMQIDVKFTDTEGNDLSHVNYKVTAMQGDEVVIEDGAHDGPAHTHEGDESHTTRPLPVDAAEVPVEISVHLYGFGVDEVTGPSGEVAKYTAVPEFGTIALIVLAVAIVSTIAITAKTRLVPRI